MSISAPLDTLPANAPTEEPESIVEKNPDAPPANSEKSAESPSILPTLTSSSESPDSIKTDSPKKATSSETPKSVPAKAAPIRKRVDIQFIDLVALIKRAEKHYNERLVHLIGNDRPVINKMTVNYMLAEQQGIVERRITRAHKAEK